MSYLRVFRPRNFQSRVASRLKHFPLFQGMISCLGTDSRRVLLIRGAILAYMPGRNLPLFQMIANDSCGRVEMSQIRDQADNGRLSESEVSCQALMRRERQSLRPPIFLEHFLSGTDNGRNRLIKAQSGLGSIGDYPRLQRGLSPVLDVPVQILNQG